MLIDFNIYWKYPLPDNHSYCGIHCSSLWYRCCIHYSFIYKLEWSTFRNKEGRHMWILQNGHNHENSQCTTMVRSMLGNVHLETMCMLSASLFLVGFVFLKVFCVAFFNHCLSFCPCSCGHCHCHCHCIVCSSNYVFWVPLDIVSNQRLILVTQCMCDNGQLYQNRHKLITFLKHVDKFRHTVVQPIKSHI